MAKPNYQFEKRQKELEKKKKQEQKRLRKLAENQPAGEGATSADQAESPQTDGSGDASTS
ncbi:MAG: hypothetical protein IV108_06590 [Burkholderiales bacterium]|nr:hypothetical protein [Burkholderiales bacterium]